MSTFDDVNAAIERRLAGIHDYSLEQLRNCTGPLSMHEELVDGIRQDMNTIESLLEELALLAEDQDTEQQRRRVLAQLEAYRYRISPLRQSIREATLSSKRRIESQNTSTQREELFKTANKASASIKTKATATSKEDELMTATASVTDGLRRTRQLMEQELEKSSLSAKMLERSSQTLTMTTDQYTSFNGLLQSSKQLITALEKADSLDRILIIAALIFFALVCLLIIKRRIIDRGIRAASLVGKVAGGAAGVGKKGARAFIPTDTVSALKQTVTQEMDSLAQTVSTIVASASSIASTAIAAKQSSLNAASATSESFASSSIPIAASSVESLAQASVLSPISSQMASASPTAIPAAETSLSKATSPPYVIAEEPEEDEAVLLEDLDVDQAGGEPVNEAIEQEEDDEAELDAFVQTNPPEEEVQEVLHDEL